MPALLIPEGSEGKWVSYVFVYIMYIHVYVCVYI